MRFFCVTFLKRKCCMFSRMQRAPRFIFLSYCIHLIRFFSFSLSLLCSLFLYFSLFFSIFLYFALFCSLSLSFFSFFSLCTRRYTLPDNRGVNSIDKWLKVPDCSELGKYVDKQLAKKNKCKQRHRIDDENK